jgi:hypothetical protein
MLRNGVKRHRNGRHFTIMSTIMCTYQLIFVMKNELIRARCMNIHITCGGNKFIPDFDRHISKGERHIGDHDVDVGVILKVRPRHSSSG